MKRYDYNNNMYLLPLKINLSKSNISFTYIGAIFLFVTLPFFLLSFFGVEKCLDKGFDLKFMFLIIATFLVSIVSLIIILPRRLIIDAEKVQLKCLVYKKEIYWDDLTSLSTNVSDVAFAVRPVLEKNKSLVTHKANQTMPGFRVGIKKMELVFRKRNGKMGTFKFFIAIDSHINFDILTKTISHTYKKAKMELH